MGNKKDKALKQEQLQPVTEITVDEKREREKERVEIKESYILPAIPLTPLSGDFCSLSVFVAISLILLSIFICFSSRDHKIYYL